MTAEIILNHKPYVQHVDSGPCCECGDPGHGCDKCPVFDGPEAVSE